MTTHWICVQKKYELQTTLQFVFINMVSRKVITARTAYAAARGS